VWGVRGVGGRHSPHVNPGASGGAGRPPQNNFKSFLDLNRIGLGSPDVEKLPFINAHSFFGIEKGKPWLNFNSDILGLRLALLHGSMAVVLIPANDLVEKMEPRTMAEATQLFKCVDQETAQAWADKGVHATYGIVGAGCVLNCPPGYIVHVRAMEQATSGIRSAYLTKTSAIALKAAKKLGMKGGELAWNHLLKSALAPPGAPQALPLPLLAPPAAPQAVVAA
jgi:hypothetical protein